MISHYVTIGVFALLGVFLLTLAVVAHLPRTKVPSVAAMVHAALGRRSVQVLLVLAWWWVGWHFFASGG